MASFQGNAAAWEAYLAEGNAKQARKRVAADVLVRDTSQRILLVDPSYKPDWDLPGGMAEANEPPLEAARREVREELGLELAVGRLLCVDWVSPHGPWDDTLMFLFDGGTLTAAESASVRLLDKELVAYEFCTEEQAARLLRPYVWRRRGRPYRLSKPVKSVTCKMGSRSERQRTGILSKAVGLLCSSLAAWIATR